MQYILIVDNSDKIIPMFNMAIDASEMKIIKARDEKDVFFKLRNQYIHLVVCDIEFAGKNDYTFANRLKDFNKSQKQQTAGLILTPDLGQCPPHLSLRENIYILNAPFDKVTISSKLTEILTPEPKAKSKTSKNDSSITLLPGQVLIQEGSKESSMFLIKKGQLTVYKSIEGKDVVLGTLKSGQIVGEMAFLDELPRSASVKAEIESVVQLVPSARFTKVMMAQPAWFKVLMVSLSHRLRDANSKIT